jgi:hypothetical protein
MGRYKTSEEHREYLNWYFGYLRDWLFLELGNKCAWCDRTSQEIELEIDHVIGVLRFVKTKGQKYYQGNPINLLVKDYESGEELRLLCLQCHHVRHAM